MYDDLFFSHMYRRVLVLGIPAQSVALAIFLGFEPFLDAFITLNIVDIRWSNCSFIVFAFRCDDVMFGLVDSLTPSMCRN